MDLRKWESMTVVDLLLAKAERLTGNQTGARIFGLEFEMDRRLDEDCFRGFVLLLLPWDALLFVEKERLESKHERQNTFANERFTADLLLALPINA